MKRELAIAIALGSAVAAMSIPSVVRSLTPQLDAEIRGALGELHAARASGGRAGEVVFGPDGKPIGGRWEIIRSEYTIIIEEDGRIIAPQR